MPPVSQGSGTFGAVVEGTTLAGLLVLLSAETLLNSIVGGKLAVLAVVGPLALYAYWVLVVRVALSPGYRNALRSFGRRLSARPVHSAALAVFYCLFLTSIVRAWAFGSIDAVRAVVELARWTAVMLLMVSVAARSVDRDEPAPVLRPIVVGLAVYAGINVLLVVLGVRNEVLRQQVIAAPESAVMLRLLGIELTRMVLPLGSSTGGIQVASGLAIAAALLWSRSPLRMRVFAIGLAAASVVCVLVTDSRGGALAGVLGAAAVLLPAMLRRHVCWLAPGVLLLPLALLLGIGALSNGSLLQEVSRAGESSVGALSGRPLIWGTIALFLAAFQPMHLIGYGAIGQLASGVNARYAFLFSTSYASTDSIGAHNTFLQLVLEVGYLGAFVVLALLWMCLRRCADLSELPGARGTWGMVGLACGVSLIILGITDSTLSIGTPNTMALFLGLNLHCALSGAETDKPS